MPRPGQALRDVARDLKRAGTLGRGLSGRMRRNIMAAVKPLEMQVKRNALAIPTHGTTGTGLRAALAHATRTSVSPIARRNATIRLIVDGARMPANQSSLPVYMEGNTGARATRWRHPVFGPHNSPTWVAQASHPFVAPAVASHLPGIDRSVIAAVDETAALLAAKGY